MDNTSIILEVVTPERLLLSKPVQMIMVTGSEGAMGILPGHTHLLSSLKIDALRWLEGEQEKRAFLNGGFMEVTPEKVCILTESAELAEEIDKERVQTAKRRAEERLAQKGRNETGIDFVRAESALDRAISRLKTLQQ
jgi:F-type H+-transporting ATPase subunit epsilon